MSTRLAVKVRPCIKPESLRALSGRQTVSGPRDGTPIAFFLSPTAKDQRRGARVLLREVGEVCGVAETQAAGNVAHAPIPLLVGRSSTLTSLIKQPVL
jgi:hypothetical protein